jgi:PAS domain S-box-containing protein
MTATETQEADLPFRQVAQDLPTPCWISDAEGAIIWVNAAWLAYTGMDVAAIRENGLEPLHDPAIFQAVRKRWAEVKARGEPGEMDFPLRGADGELRPFTTRVVPLRDAAGKVTRWFGTNTDTSVQARMQADLHDSRRRLELATEAAELGIWDWNLADNSFVYSPRARLICGFPLEGPIALEDVVRVTHPDDYPSTWAMAQRALDPAIRSSEKYRYRIVRPDGDVRTVEAHGRAVFEPDGAGAERASRYVGTLQDVTGVTRLAAASRETQALLNSLFDASELYIAVLEITDDAFRYILVNKATARFYGRPADGVSFDAREIGIPESEIRQWRQTLTEVWASKAPKTVEYAFDGGRGEGWYIGTYTPLPPGPSGEARVSFVVIDVTEKKRAEERQALLMREVDHRAKNALAVVQAVVQLSQGDTVEAYRRAVQGRIASLARVHTLLADERWTGADLRRLIEDELEPYRTDRQTRILLDGPSYALAPAVAQSIGLVIHELTTNAAKYGALRDPDGRLNISWRLAQAGDLEIVWRERTGKPTRAPAGGGFGFRMLQQLIERQLGGRWKIDGEEEGLTYSIVLPHSRSDPADAASTPGKHGLNTLIVEDEPMIALALEEMLASLRLTSVSTAMRLSEAEDFIEKGRFDIALLDLNLAGESTFDLARRLIAAGTRVVFCTGYQAANLPADLAAARVLIKPIQLADLRACLGRA